MKKMLSILTVLSVTSPLSIQVVSCSNKINLDNPYLVGKNIDKSKAKDSSGNYKFGVSNFYVIGDSLTDQNGLTELVKNKFSTSKLKINLELSGDGYGYNDPKTNIHYSTFSNGPTASVQTAALLGLESFNSSNQFVNEKEQYGRTYSVGGATAGKISDSSGIILNDVTVDKQTRTLISQQVIHDNDIVFFEIGGNDLMSLIKLQDNPTAQLDFIENSLKNLRTAFLNLLNNGVKNIIFMTPPIMSFTPRYVDAIGDEQKAITNVCNEYYERILELLDEMNYYYNNAIHVKDMYKETLGERGKTILEKKWLDSINDASIKEQAIKNMRVSYTSEDLTNFEVKLNGGVIDTTKITNLIKEKTFNEAIEIIISFLEQQFEEVNNLEIKVITEKNKNHDKIEPFFFTDFIHPTTSVHKIVADDLMEMIEEVSKTWKN